jgi:hypothetical protein
MVYPSLNCTKKIIWNCTTYKEPPISMKSAELCFGWRWLDKMKMLVAFEEAKVPLYR